MDQNSTDNDKEVLYARIQDLERERDDLQKDIEQLCMQQGGSSYITIATQMYCRRTAGLEQQLDNLKTKLAHFIHENSNIKDELSEAKRIKSYLDELHKLEVAKNIELNKQLEYLRGAVTNAFADRDQAILEAERAKESEDLMRQKLSDAEKRLQELTAGSTETQEQLLSLEMKLEKQNQEIEVFRKIINNFYEIRQQAFRGNGNEESGIDESDENVGWDEKCACLCNDSSELWSFNIHKEASTANYVAALQEELESLRSDLQNKMQMGWEIEKHLKRKVKDMEQKMILSDRLIAEGISKLHRYHSQQKTDIRKLLDEEKSYLQSAVSSIMEKIEKLPKDIGSAEVIDSSVQNASRMVDAPEILTQALQEKVSALVRLSQEEERHVLEENFQSALQHNLDELHRALQLATREKVNALLELSDLKREYQLLLEKIADKETLLSSHGERRIVALGNEGAQGTLKNIWKKTSLKRWLATEGKPPAVAQPILEPEASSNDARLLWIENANLKESIDSLVRLTSNIRKLRVSLIQAKHTHSSKGASTSTMNVLDKVIKEAEMVKTSLSAALPLSWSGEGDAATHSDVTGDTKQHGDSNAEKMDSVSLVGFEMVELVTLAAQMMKEKKEKKIRKENRSQ